MEEANNKKNLIFIPCYNCAPQIQRVLNNLSNEVFQFADILIVDNCSLDDTLQSITTSLQNHSNKEQIVVMKNNQNYGLGGSFKNAFEYARIEGYEYFSVLHGDDQADSKDLLNMISLSQKDSSIDAFFGSRFHKDSNKTNYSKIRCYANKALNLLTSALTGHWITEIGSGLNTFKISSYSKGFIESLPNHVAFDLHLLLTSIENKLKYIFVPISWKSYDEVSTINDFSTGSIIIKDLIAWRLKIKQKEVPRQTQPWMKINE